MITIDINDYPESIRYLLAEIIEEHEGDRGAIYEKYGSAGSELIGPILDIVPLLKDHPEQLSILLRQLLW